MENISNKLQIIREALKSLHSRPIFDIFGLYLVELVENLEQLYYTKLITYDLKVINYKETLVFPNFSSKRTKRLDVTWDYFVYIYMSHKIQNIKYRKPDKRKNLLYLRGFDSQFTIQEDTNAITSTTHIDQAFQISVLDAFKSDFNIIKVLSQSDLKWAMMDIGHFLAKYGYSLGSVAEFARYTQQGVYLNVTKWKERISSLMDTSDVFFVYVSNQTEGLQYELESLLEKGLEQHTILFLNEDWREQRQSIFESQKNAKQYIRDENFTIQEEGFQSENEQKINQLINQFPHQLEFKFQERQDLQNLVLPLVNNISRNTKKEIVEIPFDFHINLNDSQKEEVNILRSYISGSIDYIIETPLALNLAPLHTFLEMDVLLNLIHGEVNKAAASMAKYNALANFSLKYALKKNINLSQEMKHMFEHHSMMSESVSIDAFSLGEWNQYDNRLKLAKDTVKAIHKETTEFLMQKLPHCKKFLMLIPTEKDHKKIEEQSSKSYSKMLDKIFSEFKKDHDENDKN